MHIPPLLPSYSTSRHRIMTSIPVSYILTQNSIGKKTALSVIMRLKKCQAPALSLILLVSTESNKRKWEEFGGIIRGIDETKRNSTGKEIKASENH